VPLRLFKNRGTQYAGRPAYWSSKPYLRLSSSYGSSDTGSIVMDTRCRGDEARAMHLVVTVAVKNLPVFSLVVKMVAIPVMDLQQVSRLNEKSTVGAFATLRPQRRCQPCWYAGLCALPFRPVDPIPVEWASPTLHLHMATNHHACVLK